MLTQGREVYILVPNQEPQGKDRVLIQGRVIECNAETFIAQFDEPLSAAVGANVFAHAEINQKFLQQAANVQAILPSQDGEKPLIAFARSGEPISAECRNAFRVSIAAANLPATVAHDQKCQLVDVSATGFGVYSKTPFNVGDVVEVELTYNSTTCAGKARVQSVKETGWTKKRYGLHAIEAPRGHGKNGLQAGLGQIAAAVQRDQLRRLARA